MADSGENLEEKQTDKKITTKCDQNDNQYAPENIIVEVLNDQATNVKTEADDESAGSLDDEEFTYSTFSCDILNKAVLASMEMGYTVDWRRVSRFINHNNAAQPNPNLEPSPDDEVSREMVARMREMFISMTVDRP